MVTSSHRGYELPPVLLLRTTHKVPVTVQENMENKKKFDLITKMYPCIEMLDERKEQCRFAKRCLLISRTFMNFPKPGVIFHDFSRPGKRKSNSMTFPGFP